jgi:hypothetical protein
MWSSQQGKRQITFMKPGIVCLSVSFPSLVISTNKYIVYADPDVPAVAVPELSPELKTCSTTVLKLRH